MDLIFSRRRIKLPKIKFTKKNNFRNNKEKIFKSRKFIKIICITIVAIFVAWNIVKQIEPILEKECLIRAKSIATEISNKQASLVMSKYKYEDLCNIVKDDEQNIKMIKSNVNLVNEIISDVAVKIQEELNKLETDDIYIRLGSFTGSKFLAGRGPKVNFKISSIGNVETDLKSEFIAAGINQTMHKIYLQVDCNVVIVTPFNHVEENITNQILIAEAVILGNVPSSYYNFDGITQENLVDVVE